MDRKIDIGWFTRVIRVLLEVTGKHKPASKLVIDSYFEALEPYPKEHVRQAVSTLTATFTTNVTPADIVNAVRDIRAAEARREELADSHKPKKTDPRGEEFAKMKGAAAPLFLRRVLQMNGPIKIGGKEVAIPYSDEYRGEFDYKMIVSAVPIPKGLDLNRTEGVWKAFFAALSYEWDKYVEAGGTA